MTQASAVMTAVDDHLTTLKTLFTDFAQALLSIGRYRALSEEVDRLMHSSDEVLSAMNLRRDEIAHHVARKYQLID